MPFVICLGSDAVMRVDVMTSISQLSPGRGYLSDRTSRRTRSLALIDPFCSAVNDQASGNVSHDIHKVRTLGNEEAAVAFSVRLCLLQQHKTLGQMVSKKSGVPRFWLPHLLVYFANHTGL